MIGKRSSLALTTFVEDKVEDIKKVDIDIWSPTLKQDTYREALLNTTKLWLLSRSYDRVRKPNWAGFFDGLLREYPMNSEGAAAVERDLLAAIEDKIPDIVITEVKATPDLVNKGWYVYVKSIDTDTNLTTAFAENEALSVFISSDMTNTQTLAYSADKKSTVISH